MLRLLFRYTTLMYHRIACRIRFSFALLATYVSSLLILLTSRVWQEHKGLCWYILVLGSDTDTLPTYYKRFNYVVRIKLIAFHPTFCISHLLSRLTYSRIKLYYSHSKVDETYSVDEC